MTEYYYAKEREESAVKRINDSYLEALNSLEKLEAENAKLRDENELLQAHVRSLQSARMHDWNERERLNEFVVSLADQFNINGEWADARWCLSGCMCLFKCHPTDGEVKIRCPAWARLRELGVVK